jgi:Cu2+-exporting ATPase
MSDPHAHHHAHHQSQAKPPGDAGHGGHEPAASLDARDTPGAPGAHAGHAGHDKHAGHSVAMFRDRFWLSLLLTLPTLVWGHMLQNALAYTAPMFPAACRSCAARSARSATGCRA